MQRAQRAKERAQREQRVARREETEAKTPLVGNKTKKSREFVEFVRKDAGLEWCEWEKSAAGTFLRRRLRQQRLLGRRAERRVQSKIPRGENGVATRSDYYRKSTPTARDGNDSAPHVTERGRCTGTSMQSAFFRHLAVRRCFGPLPAYFQGAHDRRRKRFEMEHRRAPRTLWR